MARMAKAEEKEIMEITSEAVAHPFFVLMFSDAVRRSLHISLRKSSENIGDSCYGG